MRLSLTTYHYQGLQDLFSLSLFALQGHVRDGDILIAAGSKEGASGRLLAGNLHNIHNLNMCRGGKICCMGNPGISAL